MRQNRKQDTVKTGRRSSVWSCSVHPLDTYVNFGVDVGVFTRFETGIIYPFRNTHRQKTSMLFFSRSVVCNSLWPHGLQHARLLCLSLSPRVYSDSCPLGRWCHPTISSSVAPFSSYPLFPSIGLFRWVDSSHQGPKYWSFSVGPSCKYSGLTSFSLHQEAF